jgi:hypothetical protein
LHLDFGKQRISFNVEIASDLRQVVIAINHVGRTTKKQINVKSTTNGKELAHFIGFDQFVVPKITCDNYSAFYVG